MADKERMDYTEYFADVMRIMSSKGLLLATWKDAGTTANAMTIGWGMIGIIWGRPIWQVVVRPSRYTYQLMEREKFFSVNVMPKSLDAALKLCGVASGRDRDKLTDAKLTAVRGEGVGAPVIRESVIHYECHVLHANDFIPEAMIPDIRTGCYPSGDYHRIFWGEIVDCRVDRARVRELP